MFKDISLKEELVGCFGFPVAENPRQAMIEPAFRSVGSDWRYLPLEVRPQDLGSAIERAKAFGFRGFNCAVPHKVAVIPHLDGLGESAALIGAVNCVANRGGRFIGENTEGRGFVTSLRELIDPCGKSLVILGAGGAARAIGVEMALAGCNKITLVNHDEKRGRELETLFAGALRETVKASGRDLAVSYSHWRGNFRVPEGTEILVDTTPIGLFPSVNTHLPFAVETVSAETIVADVIPAPPASRLAPQARENGCRIIDGLAMLVCQGAINVKYWTGRTPDMAVMRQALLAAIHISSEHHQFPSGGNGRRERLERASRVS